MKASYNYHCNRDKYFDVRREMNRESWDDMKAWGAILLTVLATLAYTFLKGL